jgi:hypothetical protein
VTPTATPTPSPTPALTASATPEETFTPGGGPTPEPLNEFLCYETQTRPLNRAGVSLAGPFDQAGPSTVTVQKAKRLCAPTVPLDLAHLTDYTIRQTSPRFQRIRNVSVTPQNALFPPLVVDLIRPDRLLVPAAKNVGTTIPSPLAAPIDHYECYRVKGRSTPVRGVPVETQFGATTVDVKQPLFLCAPVDKNGEGLVDSVHRLMCYEVRADSQMPQTVSTTNQFESGTFQIFGIRELCVPTL